MDQTENIYLKSPNDLAPLLARAKDEGWTSLNLRNNDLGEERAKAIAASLPNLTSLNLNVNSIGDEGAKELVASLPNLTELDLNWNNIGAEGAKAIAASLPNLTSLSLDGNNIGKEGAKAIAASLPNLTSLNLGDNSIGDEDAKAIAASLPNLTSLHLENNSIGEEGAKAIATSLPTLTSFHLSQNNLGDEGAEALAALLPDLTELTLSENSIGDEGAKSIAASLPNLTYLDLKHNNIGSEGAKAIAASLPNLTTLNLCANNIDAGGATAILDSWSKRSDESRFRYLGLLDNDSISAFLPNEIFASSHDPKAILAAYRRLAEGDQKALNEAKLLVVGNEAVGKTSLLRYLIDGRPRDPAEEKTSGIAQDKIETKRWLPGNDSEPSAGGTPNAGGVCLNVWDFGGQEMMRGTHRFFLTARSLYLLVLEDRREDDRSIHDWLKTIRNRAAGSPILVVINKSDEGKQALRLDETSLQKDYPEIIGFLRTSCNADEFSRGSIQHLREAILHAVVHDDGLKHVRDKFAPSWLRIKNEITALAAERAVLPLSEFQHLCEQGDTPADRVTDDDERRLLLRLLNDLGTIVAHGLDRTTTNTAQGITLLDPNWLTGAVYQILNHPTVRDQQGEFTREQWADWLDPKDYPAKHHDFILDMMRDDEVGLCFRLPTAPADERYLIPEALPASKPDYDGIWPEDTLRFRFHYGYLPPGLIPRFIVQAHRNLTEQKTRWRQGALFEAEGCKILVEADIAVSPKRIDIQVCGPNERRRAALAVILNELGHVHDLNPECAATPRVPLPDQPERDVSYDHLLKLEANKKFGPNYEYLPEGADRTYTVAELLDGVRHSRNVEHRSPKETPSSIHIEGSSGPVTVVQETSGDVKIETEVSNAPPRTNWADALTSWRLFSLAAATAAVVLALILYLIPSWEFRLGIAGLAALFVAVYLWVAAANPEYFFRRWIARTILAGLAINFGGIAFDTFFTSGPATGWLRFDSNVSLLFNIAWPVIVVALAVLEWQRMQQAGKMSPA